MDDIKFAPCPFCNGRVVDTSIRVNYSKMIVALRLKCTRCGIPVSLKLNFSYNPFVEAVMAWNKSVGGAG